MKDKKIICDICGEVQEIPEMTEEVGEGYTQYCCKKCNAVLIDDIAGEVYGIEIE